MNNRPCHYLIAGPSGVGKSTLAELLSCCVNFPVCHLDHTPLWVDNESIAKHPDRFIEGTEGRQNFLNLLKKLARQVISNESPQIIEGYQLLHNLNKWRGHKPILLDADEATVIRQRLKRDKEDGKLAQYGEEARIQKAREFYQRAQPLLEAARNYPGIQLVHPNEVEEFLLQFNNVNPKMVRKALFEYGIKQISASPFWLTKSVAQISQWRGKPCPRGVSAAKTGCIPKKKKPQLEEVLTHEPEEEKQEQLSEERPGPERERISKSEGGEQLQPRPPELGTIERPDNLGGDTENKKEEGRATAAVEFPTDPKDRIITARANFTSKVDPNIVPEGLRQHLNEGQIQGVGKGILSLDKNGGFLNSSGTGVGKTRQEIALAKYYADKGMKVLIITQNDIIRPDYDKGEFSGSFLKDSKTMGVDIVLNKGDKELKSGEINLTTYHNLEDIKELVDTNTVVINDESHSIKNVWMKQRSMRSQYGKEINEKAGKVAYFSATPIDESVHLAYLFRAKVFGDGNPEQTYKALGLRKSTKGSGGGGKGWEVDPKIGGAEFKRRMSGLFDQMTKEGLMFKQEVSFKGVDIGVDDIKLDQKAHQDMERIAKIYGGDIQESMKDVEKQYNDLNEQIGALGFQRHKLEREGSKNEAYKLQLQQGDLLKQQRDVNDQLMELRTAAGATAKGFNKGQMLMAQRKQLESYKIDHVAKSTLDELKQNRQVVIFASRVNDFELEGEEGEEGDKVASEGTMDKLREALEKAGISANEIVDLHGGVAKKIRGQAAGKFQSKEAKVILATTQSGGTGIDLDDQLGDSPRTMIVMTAPFSGVEVVQAAGRINRLNTKSPSKVRFVFADTDVDKWNRRIVAKKMKNVGASVSGDIGKLDVDEEKYIDLAGDMDKDYLGEFDGDVFEWEWNLGKSLKIKRIKKLLTHRIKQSPFWRYKNTSYPIYRDISPNPKLTQIPKRPDGTPETISLLVDPRKKIKGNDFTNFTNISDEPENVIYDNRHFLDRVDHDGKGVNPNEQGNIFGMQQTAQRPTPNRDSYGEVIDYTYPKHNYKSEQYNPLDLENDADIRNFQDSQARQARIQAHSRENLGEEKSLKKDKNKHSYGALIYKLPIDIRKQITDWVLENVPDFHLTEEGRDHTPHVTLAYGFEGENAEKDLQTLRMILARFGPISFTLGKFGLFEGGKDGDVLHIKVDSPKLYKLNKEIRNSVDLKGSKYEYNPHITLAYIDPQFRQFYKTTYGIKFLDKYYTKDFSYRVKNNEEEVKEPEISEPTKSETSKQPESNFSKDQPESPKVNQSEQPKNKPTIPNQESSEPPVPKVEKPQQIEISNEVEAKEPSKTSVKQPEIKPVESEVSPEFGGPTEYSESNEGKSEVDEAWENEDHYYRTYLKKNEKLDQQTFNLVLEKLKHLFTAQIDKNQDSPEESIGEASEFINKWYQDIIQEAKKEVRDKSIPYEKSYAAQIPKFEYPKDIRVDMDKDTINLIKTSYSYLFGEKQINNEILGGIACARNDFLVRVYCSPTEITTILGHWDVSADRRMYKDELGRLICENERFEIDTKSEYKGQGYVIFATQVQTLRELGASYIYTEAAGRRGSKHNGYYTWPLLGYDGTINESQFSNLSRDFQLQMGDSRSILDLYALKGGSDEWKEVGGSILDAKFDLSPNSRSMKVLADYIKKRQAK